MKPICLSAQVGPLVVAVPGHVLAVDQDSAAVRPIKAAHQLQRCRLAGAGRTDQRGKFARLNA
jgi:hypothetical protein